jgi:hypothetical protein
MPLLLFDGDDGSSPCTCIRRRHSERIDERTLFEKGMDDASLYPFTFAMDNSDLFETFLLTFQEILF